MSAKAVRTLALDLEGTLISNAVSLFPRPGLFRFLESCRQLVPRLVVYTAVDEHRFRELGRLLAGEGEVPEWFAGLEHVAWSERYKDLRLIPGADPASTRLLDDLEEAVHPEQRAQWIPIAPYDPRCDDDELSRVLAELRTQPADPG